MIIGIELGKLVKVVCHGRIIKEYKKFGRVITHKSVRKVIANG